MAQKVEQPINENFILYTMNVNDKIEKKPSGGKELSYLSWSWAYAEARKAYPDIKYSIWRDEMNRPYIYDDALGYMVFTTVEHSGNIYEMWLPVMDANNKAMKRESYQYTTKYGSKTVEPASMTDINKAIMRCLVKNLSVACGLGLYIYSGEDLPEIEEATEAEKKPAKAQKQTAPKTQYSIICSGCANPVVDADGASADMIAKATIKKYGQPYCKACIDKMKANGGN